MKTGLDRLASHWFAVARSSAMSTKPMRVVVFGNPLVLLRGNDGSPWVFEDRCPHRGAALSRGRLTADGLSCAYHGWSYRADGRCTTIPGCPSPESSGAIRLKSYAALERDGLVWISARAQQPLPERITALEPSNRRFLWQTRWQASVLDVQENFLDALHTHTVHAGLVRSAKVRRPVQVTLRTTSDGFHIDYEGQATQSGILYKLFEAPRTRERAYFSGLGVAQIEYRYASQRVVWITLCCTPESDSSTHLFGMLHLENHWAPTWLIRLLVWPLVRRVAQQDQAIVEHQQRQRRDFPNSRDLVMPFDVVRPYLQYAWEGQGEGLQAEVSRTLEL